MLEVLALLSVCSDYMLASRMIDVPKVTPMDMLDMHGTARTAIRFVDL